MNVTKRRLEDALLVVGVLAFVFGLYGAFTEPAEAGADQKVRIINHVKYYDQFNNYCSNLSYTRQILTLVVYNGYGHYYNYHIMGSPGHPNGHSYWIVGTRTIYTTIQVASCHP